MKFVQQKWRRDDTGEPLTPAEAVNAVLDESEYHNDGAVESVRNRCGALEKVVAAILEQLPPEQAVAALNKAAFYKFELFKEPS